MIVIYAFMSDNADKRWEDMSPEQKASQIAKNEAKKVSAKAEENAKRLAKLRKNPNWDEEYGDLMWNADGSLKDQNPDNDETAEQEYAGLILAIWTIFFVWAGCGTRGRLDIMALWCIIGIVGAVIIWFW